jgi:hypothetical protein
MSTNDVPGANDDNGDTLHHGCWAEHSDGSLIFVESTEANRVVYSIFDTNRRPFVEYRDAMPVATFEQRFGRDSVVGPWTWHDKTPFDWDRVIKAGFPDGVRHAFAADTLSAAQRVAESLQLRGEETRDHRHHTDQTVRRAGGIWDKISRAVAELGR